MSEPSGSGSHILYPANGLHLMGHGSWCKRTAKGAVAFLLILGLLILGLLILGLLILGLLILRRREMQMNHAQFAPAGGIQELNLDEVAGISGGHSGNSDHTPNNSESEKSAARGTSKKYGGSWECTEFDLEEGKKMVCVRKSK